MADGEYSYSLNANGSVNDINGNSVESSFTTKYGTNINVGGGSVFARILSEFGGGSQVLAIHNEALAGSTNSSGSTNWAAYAAHTIWLDKINNYGGDMGSAGTPTLNRRVPLGAAKGAGKFKFPGTNPAKAPKGFEWKGKPGSTPGSKDGNWYNPKTGESLRPDLNHPDPIGPHWDYKDPTGKWWRIFQDGSNVPK